jgi:molybdenum cofactor cytidylyltransferase
MKKLMVLLAAGLSRRFGEENKLLYPLEGKPLYRHVLDKLVELQDEETVLLVMTNTAEIQSDCDKRGIPWRDSPHAAQGVSNTIRRAVEQAEEMQAQACIFFVADQPWLRLETIQGFLSFCQRKEASLACVTAEDHRGNPVWFDKCWFSALCGLKGDIGGRKILSQHAKQVLLFPAEQAELTDIDCPPCEF